jgi:hypothetical protein
MALGLRGARITIVSRGLNNDWVFLLSLNDSLNNLLWLRLLFHI